MAAKDKLELNRANVIELFEELEYKMAPTWDNARMASKVKSIDKAVDAETQPTTEEGRQLLEEILAGLKEGKEVVIVGDDSDAGSAKPKNKEKKVATATATKKKGDKSDKADKPKAASKPRATAETDSYGFRLGTAGAKLNVTFAKIMGSKSWTPKEIVEKTKLEPRAVYHHLGDLKRKGAMVVKDGKYTMKKVK